MGRFGKTAILLAALMLFAGCSAERVGTAPGNGDRASVRLPEPTPSAAAQPGAAEEQRDAGKLLGRVTVLRYGESTVCLNGREETLSSAVFLEDGVLYVPIADIAVLMGSSFVKSGDVYSLNHCGNVSVLMPDYNVILVNNAAYVMHSTPILRDGRLSVPVEGLARALQCSVSKDPTLGVCVLEHEQQRLDKDQLKAICGLLGIGIREQERDQTIAALAEKAGCSYEAAERLAVEERLWCSDETGTASLVTLDDAGAPILRRYEISTAYEPDQVFRSELGSDGTVLIRMADGKAFGPTPDRLYVEELRNVTRRYMELKACAQLDHDGEALRLENAYMEAIRSGFFNEAYREDLAHPYETGLYSADREDNSWDAIFENARIGDFLLFSAEGAGPEYGCFNHCALIIDKNGEESSLHLLQARGAEYGVGCGLPMDILTERSFAEVSYYRGYGLVFLCRAGSFSEEEAREMADAAVERFDGAQFGYGGRLGLDEVNCTELVDESYRAFGLPIVEGDQETRLKEVLKGNTRNLVLVPDDLLFSGNTAVIAVWKR